MVYDKEANGFINVPAPEFGAIFMSNIATKRDCFKHKVFGLPSSMANFVKEVKKGMVLFLFEYERRQLFGVYRAISDGEMNIVPHAFCSWGKQFPAQVRFMPIWNCRPLSENEFHDAIRENYFSARKFHFGLSDEQVHRLLRLFSSRKLKTKLSPRMLTAGVSNRDDEDHNADLEPSLSRGYPRSSRGVRRDNDDMFLIEYRVENADKVNSAEHGYYSDKKRRIGYDGRLLGENAAEDKLHVYSLTEKLGFSEDDWSSSNDRVKSVHKINTNYAPVFSNYMEDSDHRRTADENLILRDQMVNENNMDSSFGLGRLNENRGKPSDLDGTTLGNHYAGFSRNTSVDKAHRIDSSHEPALYRKNRSDAFRNIRTASDDWHSSFDDRVGKKSHLDLDINSRVVSKRPPYNFEGTCKDDNLLMRETRLNEFKSRTSLGRQCDHQAASDDVLVFSRLKGENKECVDSFLVPAASNGNSPMKQRCSGCSTKFLAETKSPPSTKGQNLCPSCTNFHDASITRVMPYEHEFPSSCYEHIATSEVEQGSNSVCKPSSYNVHRENNFATHKGISSPYSYPEFTKNGLESASEDEKKALLRSQDGLKSSLNFGISEAMEANRFGPLGYPTALIPRPSVCRQFTRDEIHEGESWRFSSKADLDSIASHLSSENNQYADKELGDEHAKWQMSDGTHIGRRSCSPNTSWLLHQGNVLTNLDHANNPETDIVDDEYEVNLHCDSRTSRRSVFSRLSLAPKVSPLREQKADHKMSYDEYYMDTTVDEIMDMLYEEQNIVPKKKLNRKSFVRKVKYGETNWSGKHAAVLKNDAEQLGDSMMTVPKSENEVTEETVNHVLAETRVVDFKRRRETNRASEETNAKLNKEEKSNSNELTVLNAQEKCSEAAEAKDSADKPFKRRKLVRPAFDENNSTSDLNHQLSCKDVPVVSTENLDYIPL